MCQIFKIAFNLSWEKIEETCPVEKTRPFGTLDKGRHQKGPAKVDGLSIFFI